VQPSRDCLRAPLKMSESARLAELSTPAPKSTTGGAYPSKVAASRRDKSRDPRLCRFQIAGTGRASRKCSTVRVPGRAAVSGDDFITDESQTEPQDNKSTPKNAPINSVVTGTFGGQLFGARETQLFGGSPY